MWNGIPVACITAEITLDRVTPLMPPVETSEELAPVTYAFYSFRVRFPYKLHSDRETIHRLELCP